MMLASIILAASLLENAKAITNYSAQIDAAIVAKGGTTAGGLTNAPAAIAALPTGGGGGWVKPADWPDIKAIIEADELVQTTYTNSLIVLLKGHPFIGVKIRNACAYRFSDDPTTVVTPASTGTYVEHTWGDGEPYHWVILYGNTATVAHNTVQVIKVGSSYITGNVDGAYLWVVAKGAASWRNWETYVTERIDIQTPVANQYGGGGGYLQRFYHLVEFTSPLFRPTGTQAASMFNNCYALTKVPDVLDLSQCTTTANMFSGCYALTKVPDVLDLSQCTTTANMFYSCYALQKVPDVLDLSQCTTTASMFNNCYALTNVPDVLDLSQCTTTANMFSECYALTKVPDVLDLSQCTTTANMFYNCYALQKVPTNLTLKAGLSISFQHSPLIDPKTIATFDDEGNIIGGMVYNLNQNSGSTITFHTSVKNGFTSAQQSAVSAMFTSKGYTLSW